MNTKTIATVFAITAAIAMLGSASIVPAFAATKVFDTTNTGTGSGTAYRCGVDVNYTYVSTLTYTEWDNGHFTAKGTDTVVFTDHTTGKLVGKASGVFSGQGTISDLPATFQQNTKIICVGTGLEESVHIGITIHRDGSTTVHHDF
jgi:hypothetical protein